MKAQLTFMFVLLLIATQIVFAQDSSDNPRLIELKFDHKKFSSENNLEALKSLKRGEFYQLKISGINMNLYNVSIDKKDSLITSDVSIPFFGNLGLDDISKVIAGLAPSTAYAQVYPDNNNELYKISKNLDDAISKKQVELLMLEKEIKFTKSQNEFLEYKQRVYFQKDYDTLIEINNKAIYDKNLKASIIAGELKNLENEKNKILKQLIEQEEAFKATLKSPLDSAFYEINSKKTILKQICEDAQNNTFTAIDKFLLYRNIQVLEYLNADNEQDIITMPEVNMSSEQYIREVLAFKEKLNNHRVDVVGIRTNYENFITTNPDIAILLIKESKDTLLKREHEGFLSQIDKSIEIFDKGLELFSPDTVKVYLKSLILLENNAGNEYVSLPLHHSGDISKLKLTISPKNPEFGLQTYKAEYQFPTRRYFAGVGISLYYAGFKNEAYSVLETVNIDTTSDFTIRSEDLPKGEVGFAALLYVGGVMKNDWLGFHGCIGPALSIDEKARPRLAVGGGISIGQRRSMISIDMLFMAGNTEVLSNVYEEGKIYSSKPEQVTVSNLSFAGGLAIGYIYKF